MFHDPRRAIITPRLQLVPVGPALVRVALRGDVHVARCLGARLPAGWPPEFYDRETLALMHEHLGEDDVGWWMFYVIVRTPASRRRVLAGIAGFNGPPSPDGEAEVAYALAASQRGRGIAAEAVAGLTARAFAAGATRLVGEAAPGNLPSIRVLERNGFVHAGRSPDGERVRFERTMTA